MYDKLIERLREVIKFSESRGYSGMANTVEDATKAIEELSKLADAIPHVCECCVGCELEKKNGGCDHAFILSLKQAMQYLIKPHWIPVTERLPEKECKTYWICTDSGYQCECRWTNNKYGLGESDNWGWHVMDKPQYQKVIAWRKLSEPYELKKEK